MILTAKEIIKQVLKGRIHIPPFDKDNINPNSYNFRLGRKLKIYKRKTLDPAKEDSYQEIKISRRGFILKPNRFYLGYTIEEMGSNYYVPTYTGTKLYWSIRTVYLPKFRMGDIGFRRRWTLELHSIHRLKFYPKMKTDQMLFWKPKGEIFLYYCKYKDLKDSEISRIYKGFN